MPSNGSISVGSKGGRGDGGKSERLKKAAADTLAAAKAVVKAADAKAAK